MFFRRNKCNHVYHETRDERYDSFFGGYRKFICENCTKSKWIHIPNIHNIIFTQEDCLKIGIGLNEVYIRNEELERKDHYRKNALK